MRLLRGTISVFKYNLRSEGGFSHPPHSGGPGSIPLSPHEICDRHSGNGIGFSEYFGLTLSTSLPGLHIYHRLHVTLTRQTAASRNLPNSNVVSEIAERWIA
jgi:hypothetical protein